MARTGVALVQAVTALQRNRKQLQSELEAIDGALGALAKIGSRRLAPRTRRARRNRRATPKQLAALKKARAARKRKRAAAAAK